MGSIIELTADIDVEVRRSAVRIYRIGQEAVDIEFKDVAACSRALSMAKESAEYQAWLVKKGLA